MTGACIEHHEILVLESIAVAESRHAVALVTDGLDTCQPDEVVLAPVADIGGGVGPGPGVALSVGTAYRNRCIAVGGVDLVTIIIIIVLNVLDTDVRLEGKSLDGLPLGEGIAEDTPALAAVVLGIVEALHGVGIVGTCNHHRIGEQTIALVGGNAGVLEHGQRSDATVACRSVEVLHPLGHHEVFAYGEPLAHVIGAVETAAEALIESLFLDTVLVDVVDREHHRALLAAVADAGVHVMGPGGAIDDVLPVVVAQFVTAGTRAAQCAIAVAVEAVEVGVDGTQCIVVGHGLVIDAAPLLCIEQVVLAGDGLHRSAVADIDRQAVALATLGGDDDYAVGGT